MKIRKRLSINNGLLIALSLAVIVINIFLYTTLLNDANAINQGGKLRALTYSMSNTTRTLDIPESVENRANLRINLRANIREFDSILDQLKSNRAMMAHQPTEQKVNKISNDWSRQYKTFYEGVTTSPPQVDVMEDLWAQTNGFVAEINTMVNTFANHSRAKTLTAVLLNGVLLVGLAVVAVYTSVTMHLRIKKPLRLLVAKLKAAALIDAEGSRELDNLNADEITEIEAYFDRLIYDPLTQTLNRRGGLMRIQNLDQQMPVSVVLIDINGLKEVNDQLGHIYGDELIVTASSVILQMIGPDDFVIRLGGDEFLIIMPSATSEEAEQTWQEIEERFRHINANDNRPYLISVSHGVASFSNPEKIPLSEMIHEADELMYAEKHRCREGSSPTVVRKGKLTPSETAAGHRY